MPYSTPLLIISGPTAVGKSRLAIHLAQKWNTEIISADSRQIYRYMNIGTGKPTQFEQKLVQHHMIDLVNPDQFYSSGEYGRTARSIIDKIMKSGHIPILVGGTGLYIRAVIDGLAPSAPGDPKIKSAILKELEKKGTNILHQKLSDIDPPTARRLHPNDRQRIIRALEVYLITGNRLSELQKQKPAPIQCKILFLFINRPRNILYDMINQRIETMFNQGLSKEVKMLLERGYTCLHPGMQSLGYRYICEYIKRKISLQDAKRLMKRDTRRYAKRQITWFKKEKRALHIECPEDTEVLNIIPQVEELLQNL